MYPFWSLPLAAYSRRGLLGWGTLLTWLKVTPPTRDPLWTRAPMLFFTALEGHVVQADLSDCVERFYYFVGRHPDLQLHLCLSALLAAGDRFIDVGAHIGMLSLSASARVGPTGEVLAFEPNPINMFRLRRIADLNGRSNIRLFDCALSASAGQATFNLPLRAATRGSLQATAGHEKTMRLPVQMERGDTVLAGLDARPTLMKVDVEGFEIPVMEGCLEFVDRNRPAMITECFGPNFAQSGATVSQFLDVMSRTGAKGFLLQTSKVRLREPELLLTPLDAVPIAYFETHCADLLWLFEDTPMWQRAGRWIQAERHAPAEGRTPGGSG